MFLEGILKHQSLRMFDALNSYLPQIDFLFTFSMGWMQFKTEM